jgi:hypothetical protein
LGVLPEQHLARAVPLGSNFRLNIDFAPGRKIVSGEIFPVTCATRQNFPHPAIFAWWSGQITPLFDKSAGEKSRKSAEILWITAAQAMANKDEQVARSRRGAQAWPQRYRAGERRQEKHGGACAPQARAGAPLKERGRCLRIARARAKARAP